MRKESLAVVNAFIDRRSVKKARTRTDGEVIYLHGHPIVSRTALPNVYELSMCGWATPTTKERLNSFLRKVHFPNGFWTKRGDTFIGNRYVEANDKVYVDVSSREILKIVGPDGCDRI